jgi:hypothetical protein
MRTWIAAVALAALQLPALGVVSAQTSSVLDKLAGTWTAEPLEIRLNSDFDVSVWGPNASSIRKVELTLRGSGEGTIKVTRSVVDGRGRTKPASVSVEEAQLVVRPPAKLDTSRVEPIVEVVKPQRRYVDDPNDRVPLDGLAVKLMTTDLESNQLNLRFDLPDGRGSFGDTLVRQAVKPAGRRAS